MKKIFVLFTIFVFICLLVSNVYILYLMAEKVDPIRIILEDQKQKMAFNSTLWQTHLQSKHPCEEAIFSLDTKNQGFQALDTDLGTIYILFEELVQTEKGGVLKLKIGNPLSADILECNYKVSWSTDDRIYFASYSDPIEIRSEKQISCGQWNEVEVPISGVQSTIKLLKLSLDTTNISFNSAFQLKDPYEVLFDDLSVKEFQMIRIADFVLTISIEDVSQYLDSAKLLVQIGNPYACNFQNLKINASWGTDAMNRLNGLKTKEFNISKPIMAGSWNKIELILPETKIEDLHYLRLAFDDNLSILLSSTE